MHLVDFKIMFPSIKILFCIADVGRFQNQGQVHQGMLSCHSSFVDRHDEPMEALRINFHLFVLSMIQTTLFGRKPFYLDEGDKWGCFISLRELFGSVDPAVQNRVDGGVQQLSP
jgi:hypothetical protein